MEFTQQSVQKHKSTYKITQTLNHPANSKDNKRHVANWGFFITFALK